MLSTHTLAASAVTGPAARRAGAPTVPCTFTFCQCGGGGGVGKMVFSLRKHPKQLKV